MVSLCRKDKMKGLPHQVTTNPIMLNQPYKLLYNAYKAMSKHKSLLSWRSHIKYKTNYSCIINNKIKTYKSTQKFKLINIKQRSTRLWILRESTSLRHYHSSKLWALILWARRNAEGQRQLEASPLTLSTRKSRTSISPTQKSQNPKL